MVARLTQPTGRLLLFIVFILVFVFNRIFISFSLFRFALMTRRFDYACKSKQKQRNIFIYTSKYANVYFVDKFLDENLADSTTQPTEIIELGVLHIRI